METKNILGMIAGYYLSREDQLAYRELGFGNKRETHARIGKLISVPASSIKAWRDEFDPIHPNPRAGRYQRELRPTRQRVVEACGALSKSELRQLVEAILGGPTGSVSKALATAINLPPADGEGVEEAPDSTRGITGYRAEEAFIALHREKSVPLRGELLDRRFDQCGYDFEIKADFRQVAVEVKGIASRYGGISFTEKEWSVAHERRNEYILAVARNVSTQPVFDFFPDPSSLFNPTFRSHSVIQLRWDVAAIDLAAALGD